MQHVSICESGCKRKCVLCKCAIYPYVRARARVCVCACAVCVRECLHVSGLKIVFSNWTKTGQSTPNLNNKSFVRGEQKLFSYWQSSVSVDCVHLSFMISA